MQKLKQKQPLNSDTWTQIIATGTKGIQTEAIYLDTQTEATSSENQIKASTSDTQTGKAKLQTLK